jgi:hypothetical protein
MQMKFHEYRDSLACMKRAGIHEMLGVQNDTDLIEKVCTTSLGVRHHLFVREWKSDNKPYYLVYPKIFPALAGLDLSRVPAHSLASSDAPMHLLLRMPENAFVYDGLELRTVYVSVQRIADSRDAVTENEPSDDLGPDVVVGLDFGETCDLGILPIYTMRTFALGQNSVTDQIREKSMHPSAQEGIVAPDDMIHDAVSLACAVRLLGSDPDLIEPDILSSDRDRYENAAPETRQRLIDKAQRRGKRGWRLGRAMSVSPHFRSAHPALVWTGTGRTIPKIVMRKGSVVHRKAVTKVPTGRESES